MREISKIGCWVHGGRDICNAKVERLVGSETQVVNQYKSSGEGTFWVRIHQKTPSGPH